jgi:hypothetical protein
VEEDMSKWSLKSFDFGPILHVIVGYWLFGWKGALFAWVLGFSLKVEF